MKTRSVPRILALIVLTLALSAATAPAAWAVPGAAGGPHAPAWDLGSVFTWLQGFFGGWLGGGVEGEESPQSVTGKAGQVAEPNGGERDLRAAAPAPGTSEPTLPAGKELM